MSLAKPIGYVEALLGSIAVGVEVKEPALLTWAY
jgi:hypothetical protein